MTANVALLRQYSFYSNQLAIMASCDSSDESDCGEIPTTPTIPCPSSTPNNDVVERIAGKTGIRQFLVVDHSANERSGAKISAIWHHGGERRRLDDKSMDRYWRCAHCKGATVLKIKGGAGGTTSYALRHLKNKHNVNIEEDEAALPGSSASSSIFGGSVEFAASTIANVATKGYKALVSTLDATRFRKALVMFFVMCNIAFNVVESPYCQELLLACSAGALEPFLVHASNTLKRWILEEFEKKKLEIKNELATARSRIHISFDLWSSPNSLALCGIVAHYLDKELKARSYLIGLRRVKGAHSGENIAEAMIPVLEELQIVSKLGFFICDNASNNDTCIRTLLRQLRPDIKDPDSRRVRCLGHIINLSAKAFLFGKDPDAFELTTNDAREIGQLEALRAMWRKLGPVGKFHNTIKFIRITPQRREEFLGLLKGEIASDIEGMQTVQTPNREG
jgi:hypothetical protein